MTDEAYQKVISEIESMTAEDIEKLSKKLTEEMKLYTPNPWHTGTPTEAGEYLCVCRSKVGSFYCNIYQCEDVKEWDEDVVAWMPITPYEEN